jgi:hypothetical protein
VLAWNESTNETGYYEVTAAFSHLDPVLTELIIDGEWIETTPEHPFYVEGKGWTFAKDLKSGDQIRQADGTSESVWLKWEIQKYQEMYNLTVDEAHTYFVGEGQWLVHNDFCPILGRLQKNVTDAHNEMMQQMAEKLAGSGKYQEVWMDTTVSISTKGEVPSTRRPDVLGLNFKDKIAHIIEIPSPTQIYKSGSYEKMFLTTFGWTQRDFRNAGWSVIAQIIHPK